MELVYTVCTDEGEAKKISRSLLEKDLAACTNRWEVGSIFKWEGEVNEKGEVAMIIKTREENVPEVFELVKEMHTYDTPAVFSIPINFVEPEYLEWLFDETDASD